MQEALLDAIPDEGVSYARLYNFFPNWQDSTFKTILETLIDAGYVTKTAGGGGGLIKRNDEDPREQERVFLAALEQLLKAEDADLRGVRSDELREFLGWEAGVFTALRKALKERGEIDVRPGPGAFVSLVAPKARRAATSVVRPKPSAAKAGQKDSSAATPQGAEEEAVASAPNAVPRKKMAAAAAGKVNLLDASRDRDDMLSALEQLLQGGKKVTNQQLREHLQLSEARYWQARTLLHDAGKVTFDPGSGGAVRSQKRASMLPISTLNLPLQRKLLLALPRDGEPIKLAIVAENFGETREKLTEASTRLQVAGLVRFSSEGEEIALSSEVLATRSDDTDETDIWNHLSTSGGQISEYKLQKDLGWTESRFYQALSRLANRTPAVLRRDEKLGIVSLVSSPEVTSPGAGERQIPSPCRSPLQFSALVESLQAGKVIAFVGAGSSAAAGIPTWPQLIEQLLASSKQVQDRARAEIARLCEQRRFPEALSALQEMLGEHPFADLVRDALGPARQSEPCTSLVTALTLLADRLQAVVTTNLDSMLEAGFHWPVELDLTPNTAIEKKVIKVHGTLEKPETWVLTRRQYNRKYLGNAPYRDRLLALYNGGTFMFIGYGMQDVELDAILDWIEGNYQTHQQPRHFFFVHEDDEANSPFFYRRLQGLGLRPVLYRSPPYENGEGKNMSRHAYLPVLIAQLAVQAGRRG